VNEVDQAPSQETQKGARRFPRLYLWLALLSLIPLYMTYSWATYPSDKTPQGAYLRVVRAVNEAKPAGLFAYTEEAAQHACFTVRDYRKKTLDVARRSYPKNELAPLEDEYARFAKAADGADVFAIFAVEQGWMDQLRSDLSGIEHVTIEGPRATIETVKGTRYSMRQRPGGIYGLTAFTAFLVQEAERAARDFEQVERAAADFDRVSKQGGTRTPAKKSP
jgi:hypothetical protein